MGQLRKRFEQTSVVLLKNTYALVFHAKHEFQRTLLQRAEYFNGIVALKLIRIGYQIDKDLL